MSKKITIVAIVNALAAVLHSIFWIFVFIKLPSPFHETSMVERVDRVVTFGLGIADLAWCVPLLACSSFFLRKGKMSGWLAAQMANVLWWYSYTFIIFREWVMGQIRPGTLIFLPFAIFSFWAAWILWKERRYFN